VIRSPPSGFRSRISGSWSGFRDGEVAGSTPMGDGVDAQARYCDLAHEGGRNVV
jgi:hypothetical protein